MDKECEKYWKEECPLMLESHMSRAKERWEAVFSPDYDLGVLPRVYENETGEYGRLL